MKSLLLLVTNIVLLWSAGIAQTIKGKITDNNNEPVSGATVTLKGTFSGTIANNNGDFSIRPSTSGIFTLIINSTGFEQVEKTVEVKEKEEVNVAISLSKFTGSLKEVTVTASRKAEIVDRTPASVQVINSKEIQTRMQISPDIASILSQSVPSLAYSTNTTSNTGQTLRGRTPLIMVDGIPQSTPLRAGGRDIRTIDPATIERIEVVKGATAIYGNGADGGIINYITKKTVSGKPFAAYTSIMNSGMPVHGRKTFGGRITQQFSGSLNKFDYIVNGTYERTGVSKDADGVALSPAYGLGESSIYNGFAKLGYNIAPKHRLELMYNYFGSAQNTDYVEQLGQYLVKPTIGVLGEHKGEKEGTRYNHNAYLKYLAKGLPYKTELEASVYLQSFYTIYGYTSYFENGGQSTIKSDKHGIRLNLNTPYHINKSIHGDIVYGVDALQDATSQILTDGRVWVPEMKLKNAAPYLQANAVLFSDWIFKAGYRYDNINISIPSFVQVKDNTGKGGNSINGGDLSFNANTFNAGLRFAKWEIFKPYISFTQGFSIIDVGRYVRSAKENDIARMEIEPVKVNNYEIGFNTSTHYVDVAASYFISTNKIGASLIEVDGWYTQQKAPEKTYGYEIAVDARPAKFLQTGVSYMYVEGKADIDLNNKFNDPKDIYLNGTKISPPKATAYVRIIPVKPVSVYIQWLNYGDRNRFARRANGAYGYGEGPVESTSVVNLSGSWQINKSINFNLGVQNLFNKNYFAPIAQWSAQSADYIKANGIRYQAGFAIKW